MGRGRGGAVGCGIGLLSPLFLLLYLQTLHRVEQHLYVAQRGKVQR